MRAPLCDNLGKICNPRFTPLAADTCSEYDERLVFAQQTRSDGDPAARPPIPPCRQRRRRMSQLADLANQFLNQYGLIAIFTIMMLKEIGFPVPIPADLIM